MCKIENVGFFFFVCKIYKIFASTDVVALREDGKTYFLSNRETSHKNNLNLNIIRCMFKFLLKFNAIYDNLKIIIIIR